MIAAPSPPMIDYKYSTMASYCVNGVNGVNGVKGVKGVNDVNHRRGRSNTMMTSLTSSTSSINQQQKEAATQQLQNSLTSWNSKSSSSSLPSCRRRFAECSSLDQLTNNKLNKPSPSASKSICSCSSQPLPTPSSNALPRSSPIVPTNAILTPTGTSKIQNHNTSSTTSTFTPNTPNKNDFKFKAIEKIKKHGNCPNDFYNSNDDSNLIHSSSKSDVVLPKASSIQQQNQQQQQQQQQQQLLSTPISSNRHTHDNDHSQTNPSSPTPTPAPPQDVPQNVYSKTEGTPTPTSKNNHDKNNNNGLILIRSRISREDLIKEDALSSDRDGYEDDDDDSSHDSTTTRIIRQRIKSSRKGRERSQSTSVLDSMLGGSDHHNNNNNNESTTPLSKSWNAFSNTQSLVQQNHTTTPTTTAYKAHHQRLTHPNIDDVNNHYHNHINNTIPLYKLYDQDFMIHSKRFIETNISPSVRPTYTIHRNIHVPNNNKNYNHLDNNINDNDNDECNYNDKFANEATERDQNHFGHYFVNKASPRGTGTTGIHSTNQITTTTSKRRSRDSHCHKKAQSLSDVNFLGKVIVCQLNNNVFHENDTNENDNEYGSITSSSFSDDIIDCQGDHQDQYRHLHINNGMMNNNVYDWEMLKSNNVPLTTITAAAPTTTSKAAVHVTSSKTTEEAGLLIMEDGNEDDEINTNERNCHFVNDKGVVSTCSAAAAPVTGPSCPLGTTGMEPSSVNKTLFHMNGNVVTEDDLDVESPSLHEQHEQEQHEVQFSFLEDDL